MQVKSTRSGKKARIEIIPLIDVIMFLLATFVLFTLSMTKTKTIPLELPTGQPSDIVTEPPVNISVDSNGDYFWNKDRISLDDMLIRINNLKAQSADPKIVVAGEEGALFGRALLVIDEARKAQIFKVSFDTQAKKSIRN